MSSTFFDISKYTESSPTVSFNYPELFVDNAQRKVIDESYNIITANYLGNLNEPDVILTDMNNTPTKYQARKLYICGHAHDINIPYDGELIIEHTSTSTDTKLYTCFLLKTEKEASVNVVDSIIINTKSSSDTNSNKVVPLAISDLLQNTANTEKKAIMYKDTDSKYIVLINTGIIRVKSDMRPFSSDLKNIMTVIPANYKIIPVTPNNLESFTMMTRENFQEGLETTQTCVAITEGDTKNVLVSKEDNETKQQKKDAQNVITAFIVFISIIGIICTYFVSPPIYTDFIFEKIKPYPFLKNVLPYFGNVDEFYQLKGIDMLLSFVFIVLIIVCFVLGITKNDPITLSFGIAFLTIYVVGVLSIVIKKMSKPNVPVLPNSSVQ